MEKKHRYEQICDHFVTALETGTILIGEKLPSLRTIASQFSCSVSSAIQAYRLLEQRGYLRAVEKSGFYAQRPTSGLIPAPHHEEFTLEALPAAPHALLDQIMALAKNKSLVQLNAAVPHLSLLPHRQLQKAIIAKARTDRELLFEYADAQGSFDLRSEIARRMVDRGVPVSAKDLIITNGCTDALALAVESATSEGDTVAVESPVFFGIISLLQRLNRKAVEIPVSVMNGIDTSILEQALLKQKIKACIVTANFQNPLGFVMPEHQKGELLRLAKAYDFVIIEDDVYGECWFNGKAVQPLKAMDTDNRVIYCSSFSKTLAPGVRIGWAISQTHLESMKQRKYASAFGGISFIQEAVGEYLRVGRYEPFLKQYRKSIQFQTEKIYSLVTEHFPADSKISRPVGGFFLWIECGKDVDAVALFEQALKKNVGILPGGLFSISDKYRSCIRISCVAPVTEAVVQGIAALGELLTQINANNPAE